MSIHTRDYVFRATHIPTGEFVEISGARITERHMHRVRNNAIRLLLSRLRAPQGRTGALVRDYEDWTDEDWRKPEDRLDMEILNEHIQTAQLREPPSD